MSDRWDDCAYWLGTSGRLVIYRGTRADAFSPSHLWPNIQVQSLPVNIRVHLKGNILNLLLEIGDENLLKENGKVYIPDNLCVIVTDLKTLNERLYPDLRNLHVKDPIWFKDRDILTPKKETATNINDTLLKQLPTKIVKYQSVVELEDKVH